MLGLWPDGLERQLRLAATATGASLDDLDATLKRVDTVIDGFAPARRPTSIISAHPEDDGQVYVWAAGSPGSQLMELLGLPALSSPPPDADGLGAYVSPERLDLLEADLLLISSSTADDPAVAALRANPIFPRLDVVADGRTAVLTEEETTAVHDVTVLSLPVAVAALNRALA